MILMDRLKDLVEERCRSDENVYGMAAFRHISFVAFHSRLLADALRYDGADPEVCEAAGWLHDIGSIMGRYKDHHVFGSHESERILQMFGYPQNKIEQVKYCILTHRGSRDLERETLDSQILASADAIASFADIPSLFHLAYKIYGLDYEKGKKFVRDKLKRSWKKMLPKAQQLVEHWREISLKLLKNDT